MHLYLFCYCAAHCMIVATSQCHLQNMLWSAPLIICSGFPSVETFGRQKEGNGRQTFEEKKATTTRIQAAILLTAMHQFPQLKVLTEKGDISDNHKVLLYLSRNLLKMILRTDQCCLAGVPFIIQHQHPLQSDSQFHAAHNCENYYINIFTTPD